MMLAAAASSIAKSLSLTESSELAVGAENPSSLMCSAGQSEMLSPQGSGTQW